MEENALERLKSDILKSYIHRYQLESLNVEAFQAISQFLLEEELISYEKFITVRNISSKNIRKYFTSKIFLYFRPDIKGFIRTEEFIGYLQQAMKIEIAIQKLLPYLVKNESPAVVSVEQWQWILRDEYLALLDPFQQIDESFHEFYLCTIVQKFCFFLDSANRNTFRLRSLVHSDVFNEMLTMIEFQNNIRNESEYSLSLNKMSKNWFCVNGTINIYTSFLNLDVDHNGLLSVEEVKFFKGCQKEEMLFTHTAWTRILEELVMFDPFELDYKGFVKLWLALEDFQKVPDTIRKNQEIKDIRGINGLKFFWSIIDFNRSGHLSPKKIKLFYQEISHGMNSHHQVSSLPSPDEIVVEIYDLLGYNDVSQNEMAEDYGPTFEDVIYSCQSKTVLMMLLDTNNFWRYEFRESLIGQDNNNEEVEEMNSVASKNTHPNISSIKIDSTEAYDDDYDFD